MLNRLKELEATANLLEPTPQQREAVRKEVVNYGENFLNSIYDQKAYVHEEDKGKALYDFPLSDEPLQIEKLLSILDKNVDNTGLNPASRGHLGYIPGGGIYYSSLADYLADISNRYAGVFFASPGAVRMENMLLRWMSDITGYPQSAGGNLTSGGSIANLVGIVTARDAKGLKARDFEKTVIYLTHQVHHSVDKAIRIAGLNEAIKRYVKTDTNYRLDINDLELKIKEDTQSGLHPFMVIASAGTTDTGAVDPMAAIGAIAEKNNLWFHIDGAYGAFFALCDEGKKILKGMDTSDSIVMDPHKGLFLPYGSGAVLVKDVNVLKSSQHYLANYMQDTLKSQEEHSPADLSPELTKHFRGLRLWLPLQLLGLKPFKAALEEKMLLARYFYEKIQEIPGFEVGNYPDLSVVTYRYIPKTGDANEFNKKLVDEVQKDGRVFLTSTILEGKFVLRIAILSFRTHLDTIDQTLEILKEKVKIIEGNSA